ncbi:hypothetical protein BKA81DRAFT_303626 [Phyllosticta paracitricarpa]|uniref:Uncharacterized protein n=1 Tax=Phyllosticta paracitricarpa TaxID=2016321 RepID=A0ABR1MWS1_9PEZI
MHNDSPPSAVDGAGGREAQESIHGTSSGRGSRRKARARKHDWQPRFSSSWKTAFAGSSSSSCDTKPKSTSNNTTTKSIIPLLLLLALATLSTRLFSLPLNRVIESRYCAEYYHSPSPPEAQCKIDWVQRRLAWLQGVIETAVIGVDLGVAVPAAWVGDRWREKGRGRRAVLAANLLGWAGVVVWVVIVGHLEGVLPVSAMAAAPFFALIGGHDCVLNSAVFAIVTDLTDDLYLNRTSYIAYITSVNYVVSLFGPSLASAAMTVNLWLPFYLSIGFLISALPVVYFLPLDNRKWHDSPAKKASSSSSSSSSDIEAAPLLPSPFPSSPSPSSPPLPLKTRLTHLIQQRPRFLLLLASFLLTSLASSNTHLLPQYMSARYARSFASVGPLLSLKAATNIVLLTLVVPIGMRDDGGGDEANNNTHTSQPIGLNIDAALLSLLISVCGACSIAAAPSVPILVAALLLYALGSALPVFTMALVDATRPSNSSATARVYTVVMVVKTIGSLVGAPLMTAVWVAGIGVGGAGLGLPFWVSAVSVLLLLPLLLLLLLLKNFEWCLACFPPCALFFVVLFCFAWFAGLLLMEGGLVVEVEEMNG